MTADQLVEALRAEGCRITVARRAVCAALAEQPGAHLSAAELREASERLAGHSIDTSTVYRTMEVLERVGLLAHVHTGQGVTVVHTADEPHHHLSCRLCGAVVDVDADSVRDALEPLAQQHGFTADTLHFALVGTCAACRTTAV